MRPLVDAHTLIWAVDDPSRLSAAALAVLQDPSNELLLGAGTMWELAIKCGLGKLVLSQSFRMWMTKAILDLNASVLPVAVAYADAQISLPNHHKDPFDRLLIAQAMVENEPVVSADVIFDLYGIKRIW